MDAVSVVHMYFPTRHWSKAQAVGKYYIEVSARINRFIWAPLLVYKRVGIQFRPETKQLTLKGFAEGAHNGSLSVLEFELLILWLLTQVFNQ